MLHSGYVLNNMMYIFRILLLLILSVSAGFISLSYRMGGVAPRDFAGSAPVKSVEAWQTAHPDSLIALSQRALLANNLKQAEKLAIQAFSKDITNGRAAAQLLQIYSEGNNHEGALKIAQIAGDLWPSHAFVHSKLADYWLASGNIVGLVDELDKLLRTGASSKNNIFSIYHKLIADKEVFPLFIPYIENPPEWWIYFFKFIVSNSKDSEDNNIIDIVYHERNKTKKPPDYIERNIYIKSLVDDERWSEAYFIWLGQLDENQLQLNALLHDGGFEAKKINSDIFGWQVRQDKNVNLKFRKTAGIKGEQALRISFNKKEQVNFKHIGQIIVLQPGEYSFSLNYKLNSFKATKGLSWRIYCATGKKQLLGEGPSMRGHTLWEVLNINFIVPTDCQAQYVKLEASSSYIHDHFFQGSLWFDDLKIARIF